jgi:hypothetical protein
VPIVRCGIGRERNTDQNVGNWEGFDTADLKDAKALLDELQQQ